MPSVEADGYAIAESILTGAEVAALRDAAAGVFAREERPRAGVRSLLTRHPAFHTLAQDERLRELVADSLGGGAFVVRSILFDKSPERNWDVVWHQDTTIAVMEHLDVPGFGPWSVKDRIPHVQPPSAVLDDMLTVRIHLDDCGPHNGGLQVVPGSHRRGIIPDRAIDSTACEAAATTCSVRAGGVLLMRPLILHASKKATVASHRRVVHLEFAAGGLPGGLRWANC
jgi:ectoine hydroxylase-related dioxygenase (phytanoyl-CoA dioxygenase family)